jgi:hypothetical protein
MSKSFTVFVIGRLDPELEVVDPVEEVVGSLELDALTFKSSDEAEQCYRVAKPLWKYAAKKGDKVMKVTITVEEIIALD